MKTNIGITLSDAERDALANLLDGKTSKRLASRADVTQAVEDFIRYLLEAATAPQGEPEPSVDYRNHPPTIRSGGAGLEPLDAEDHRIINERGRSYWRGVAQVKYRHRRTA